MDAFSPRSTMALSTWLAEHKYIRQNIEQSRPLFCLLVSRLRRFPDASPLFASECRSPPPASAPQSQNTTQEDSDEQLRHLLDLIRRAAPFSSRPAPPTELPCYERFPRCR